MFIAVQASGHVSLKGVLDVLLHGVRFCGRFISLDRHAFLVDQEFSEFEIQKESHEWRIKIKRNSNLREVPIDVFALSRRDNFFEPHVERVSRVTVHLDFRINVESDIHFSYELFELTCASWLRGGKLIAGKSCNIQPLVFVFSEETI